MAFVLALVGVGCSATSDTPDAYPVGTDVPAASTTTVPSTQDDSSAEPVAIPLGDPRDAVVCHDLGLQLPLLPTSPVTARVYIDAIDSQVVALDPKLPEAIAHLWTDATAGLRALQAEWDAAARDWTAIAWGAAESPAELAARAQLADWCMRRGIELGSPQPAPAVLAPEPPANCAERFLLVHLGNDVTPDWIAAQEPQDASRGNGSVERIVCNSQPLTYPAFRGPNLDEAFFAIDINEDGVDDLIAIGGTSAYGLFVQLWAVIDTGIVPLLDESGRQVAVEASEPWDGRETPAGWYGCGDFTGIGDGIRRLASGTYDISENVVAYTGEEWTIEGDQVVASAGVFRKVVSRDGTTSVLSACRSAEEVRAAAVGVDRPLATPNVRFADGTKTTIEVCADHLNPTNGAPATVCTSDPANVYDLQAMLPYTLGDMGLEYFRLDVAFSLADVDLDALPLGPGSTGVTVEQVQRGLEGFCLHIADEVAAMRPGEEFVSSTPGIYDNVTAFMVRRFQEDQQLPIDGIYNTATHTALLNQAVENTPSNEGCFA